MSNRRIWFRAKYVCNTVVAVKPVSGNVDPQTNPKKAHCLDGCDDLVSNVSKLSVILDILSPVFSIPCVEVNCLN